MSFFQYWIWQARRSSFRILSLALVLAVAAISSVGVFSARIEAALMRDASQMLGGDLVIESKRDIALAPWLALLSKPAFAQVETARSIQFPSVLPSEQADLLVSMKAVDGAYPLRGKLRTLKSDGLEEEISSGPPAGEVWVDQGVLGSLSIRLGDTVAVGEIQRLVTRVILIEPDRGGGFVNFAPRVMINTADLPATGLLGPGSRATWRLYMQGPTNTLQALQEEIKPMLTPVEEVETLENGRPEVNGTLSRANDFLAMAALIGTMVACVGIALVSHLFAREQASELAILKSLGYSPKRLLRMCLAGLLLLTLGTGLVGVALGWVAHWGLMALLAGLLGVNLPLAGLHYLPMGVGLAALLLLGFASVPIWNALRSPAAAVIRKQATSNQGQQLLMTLSFGACTALALCLILVQNWKLALLLFAGFAFTSLVFAAVFWSLLKILASTGGQGLKSVARIDVFQSMSKRAGMLVLQGVALALGLSALLMLSVVQGDLIDRWQDLVPEDAPNRFVFNIQPDQVQAVQTRLKEAAQKDVRLYPMVRGRLNAVNGTVITADTYEDTSAKNLVQREFNLSFTDQLPNQNTVEQGQWFDAQPGVAQVSLENSMAERLGLRLGDELRFDIAGTPVSAVVTSIRDLRWDSMEVNFYVLFPSAVLATFPQTWITSVHLPKATAVETSRRLVRQFPNLTVLDTALVISQLRKILAQVSQAVQFVFVFTVLAGGLVVVACVLTGARARTREAAIYRAMGASTSQLQRAAWIELGLLGGIAGTVAALAAQGLGWGVARFIFEFDYTLSLLNLLMGVLGGAAVSLLFGAWSVNRVCKAPVLVTLRQAAS